MILIKCVLSMLRVGKREKTNSALTTSDRVSTNKNQNDTKHTVFFRQYGVFCKKNYYFMLFFMYLSSKNLNIKKVIINFSNKQFVIF